MHLPDEQSTEDLGLDRGMDLPPAGVTVPQRYDATPYENHVGLLEFVRQRARNLHYPFLEGFVFQALGDEYASRDGMSGQALGYYGESFRILLASDAPAYAVWPLRALKHEWECSLDRFAPMLRL